MDITKFAELNVTLEADGHVVVLELDHGQLAQRLELLSTLAPPGGTFSRLSLQLALVAREEVDLVYDELLPGDRAIADLVRAGVEQVPLVAEGVVSPIQLLEDHLRFLALASGRR